MITPCALALKQCLPCNDDPIRNITAEAPDVDVFIGYRDFKWNPFLGDTYFQLGCKSFCFSEVSQQEANLCAIRAAEECVWDGGQPPGPPVPPGPNDTGGKGGHGLPPSNPRSPIRRFGNRVQTCDALCSDGSTFTETVPAGTITELSQALADEKAKSQACRLAQQNLFCISAAPPPAACVGDEGYFFQLSTSNGADLIWSIDGDLPPGLTFDFFDATITGTPTVGGSYTFMVEVTDSLGRFQSKVVTICIMEIVTPAALPNASNGQVYAQPIVQQPATVSSEVWTLVSGSLPDGILLSSNGSLTGIPTANGTSTFTLRVDATCDGMPVSCQKAFSLKVAEGGCGLDWPTITWDTFVLGSNLNGSATGSAVGDTVQFDLQMIPGPPPNHGDASVNAHGFLVADCHACSFKLRIDLIAETLANPLQGVQFAINIYQDSVLIFSKTHGTAPYSPTLVIGVNEFDVPLAGATASMIEFAMNGFITDGLTSLFTQLEMSITVSDT
jgi:hypothetical protein